MIDTQYEAEWLGLTAREAHLLLAATNGVIVHYAGDIMIQITASYLAMHISAAAQSSQQDHDEFGSDLNFVAHDSSEAPLEFHDLAEKVRDMSDDQAACLSWWAIGYWEGMRKAQR